MSLFPNTQFYGGRLLDGEVCEGFRVESLVSLGEAPQQEARGRQRGANYQLCSAGWLGACVARRLPWRPWCGRLPMPCSLHTFKAACGAHHPPPPRHYPAPRPARTGRGGAHDAAVALAAVLWAVCVLRRARPRVVAGRRRVAGQPGRGRVCAAALQVWLGAGWREFAPCVWLGSTVCHIKGGVVGGWLELVRSVENSLLSS